jgi:hypothetical protein
MKTIFISMFALLICTSAFAATTSNDLFQEAFNYPLKFTVFQKDQKLNDLFTSQGTSNLCGPTTLANLISFQKYSAPNALPNLITVSDPATQDYTQQVREFAKRCGTDRDHGTPVVNMHRCLAQYYNDSGYSQNHVVVIGPDVAVTEDPTAVRNVSYDDIRNNLEAGHPVILEIGWYQFESPTKKWVRKNGHYVLVTGYDFDPSFNNQLMLLKIVNPEQDYSQRAVDQKWDSVAMIRIPKKSDVIYPGSDFVLDGSNFRGALKRAFVKYIIVPVPK